MGLSSSKTTTKSSANSSENATRTPTNPVMVTQAMEDYLGRVKWFGAQDPNRFVAPASLLQKQAFAQAAQIGASPQFGQAAKLAGGVAGAGAPSATAQGYSAPNMGPAAGYSAPKLGQAGRYDAPTLGPAAQAGQVTIDPIREAQAASLLQNFSKYQSPYTKQVVGAAMADFDDYAGRQRAALSARGAASGAFGGSRFGIAEGELEGQLARGRSTQIADLLDQGFRTAAALSGQDSDRRQQASLANAAAANARALSQAGLTQQTSLANMAAENDLAARQAAMDEAAARYGADAANQLALAQAGYDQSAGQFNASTQNAQAERRAALEASARQFSAGAANQNSQFNAQMQADALQRQLAAAGLLGDLGNSQQANQRDNLALTAQLGAQQQQIDQQRRLAALAQIEAMGGLYRDGIPLNLFSGENLTGTKNSRGTNVTKSSPSLFDAMMQAGNLAAKFYTAGMGG